jgi:hypothetical protein
MPSKKFGRQRPRSLIFFLSGFCFLLLVGSMLTSCKSGQPTQKVNWLDAPGWDSVVLEPRDPTNPKHIEFEQKIIRAYVRGWLEEFNIDSGKHYRVTQFEFIPDTPQNPLRFKVRAYLHPEVKVAEGHDEGGGVHLYPPEPPPPKK